MAEVWEFPSQVPHDLPGFRAEVVNRLRKLTTYLRNLRPKQTVDGWYQVNVTASQTDVELTRAAGRFYAVRSGSVTGIVVISNAARTAGTLTVTVWKNTGLAGAAGASLGLSAVLDATNTSRKATTQAVQEDRYAAGDELFAAITTTGAWTPTTADISVAIEITED